MASNGIK